MKGKASNSSREWYYQKIILSINRNSSINIGRMIKDINIVWVS